jgi:hypothetical protein
MSRFVAPKKFCKVCKDAGKSESEYTSHFTRETSDPKSKVVCPTLLAQECRFCHMNGHTTKYCPVLQDKEKRQKREEKDYRYASKRVVNEEVTKKPVKKTSSNVFAFLGSDSEEECDERKEEFPALCPTTAVQVSNLSYASALTKPAIVANLPPIGTKNPPVFAKKTTEKPKLAPWATESSVKRSFWDEESDEEEDDDEDSVPPTYDEDDYDDCEDFNTNKLLISQVKSMYNM